jgi:hypothetical protein
LLAFLPGRLATLLSLLAFLAGWLLVRLAVWLNGCVAGCANLLSLLCWLGAGGLASSLDYWFAGFLVFWPASLLSFLLVGWLPYWLCWLLWPSSWLKFSCLAEWLSGSLGWVVGLVSLLGI